MFLIHFDEMSLYVFNPFSNLFVFLLFNFKSSLYFLDTNPLSDMWFANDIPSLFFHPLKVLYRETVLILMKFSLSNSPFMDLAYWFLFVMYLGLYFFGFIHYGVH